jgi:hypothetical protein
MPTLRNLFGMRSTPQHKGFLGKDAAASSSVNEFSSLSFALLQASRSTAERSNAQRQMVQDIAKMEEHIQTSARRSAANSQQTAESTEAVARDTDRGNELMETTTATMKQMSLTARESASLMRQFVLRMSEVNRVVETVRDIARQTNLLALNAAVEAAHAGSHGDGFTVIAQEIRVLADRAGQSTSEIATSIGKMSETAKAAEQAMQLGEQAADVSIQRNVEVQQSLRSIRDSMQQVQLMSADVANASNRQIAAVERLSAQLKQIDSMALESTYEADAAAEMSIRLVLSAAQLSNVNSRRGGTQPAGSSQRGSDSDRLQQRISQSRPRVEHAMELLRSECSNAGRAQIQGDVEAQGRKLPALRFGVVSAIDTAVWVDRVNQKTGCVATIFVRDGQDFVRVATNIKRADGQRATGTVLNPKGAAILRLTQRMSHEGAVYVLGKPFLASYDPVQSGAGEVIGALYVGLPLD